jgi:hypothetical protein
VEVTRGVEEGEVGEDGTRWLLSRRRCRSGTGWVGWAVVGLLGLSSPACLLAWTSRPAPRHPGRSHVGCRYSISLRRCFTRPGLAPGFRWVRSDSYQRVQWCLARPPSPAAFRVFYSLLTLRRPRDGDRIRYIYSPMQRDDRNPKTISDTVRYIKHRFVSL